MCGLAGIVGWRGALAPAERDAIVRRMAATVTHRGPDDLGFACAGACSLGFRRLSIVDLDAASPPFADERRTIWSIANAELYNANELRDELAATGHVFQTGTDTEVLPHLYEEHGVGLIDRLDGMFALAVWDSERERLLLARDRAGEKPLFYWPGEGELVFASELRALLAHPRIAPAVDPIALRRYLLHDFFPAPLTPFAGIRKLPAGHLLLATERDLTVRPYWDLAPFFGNPALARRRPAELADELDARIGVAVERRRRSDAPLGVFLSGGIDSTTLLAHLSEQVGPGVPAFSLGHADEEFDESRFARDTARHFGADLHTLVLDESDLAEGLRRIGEGFDSPLGDASTIPVHLLSLFTNQHVKVVLSGEGADELFAGYPTHLGHRVASAFRSVPGPLRRAIHRAIQLAPVGMGNVGPGYLLRRFAAGAEQDLVERHHLWFGSLGPELQETVVAERIRERWADDDPFGSARSRLQGREWPDELSQLLYTDFTMYLQDDLLTKVDRATMLASLEARAPFLDHELAEFAAGLPSRHKVSGLTTKAILRRAVRDRLPREVLSRRKRGFNIPFSRWLLHGLGEELRERFSPERVEARGLLSPEGVSDLIDEHLARRADHRKPLFNLLALDLWCDAMFGVAGRVPVARADADAAAEPVVA